MPKTSVHSGLSPTHPIVPDLPADAFTGKAKYYDRYRVPYPTTLIDDLRARAGITGGGRLLDLACGTGQVALSLAPFFGEVLAVDQETDMVSVGRKRAEACGADNVAWQVGRAEDAVAPDGVFELITVGSAFHRFHRRLVGQRAMEWLAPGCFLAVLGSNSLWTGTADWQPMIRKIVWRWTTEEPVAERRKSDQPRETFEEALQLVGFEGIDERIFTVPHVWTVDSFVGYLHSMSGISKRNLGDKVVDFEAEVRQALLSYDAQGEYAETVRFYLILARKPLE